MNTDPDRQNDTASVLVVCFVTIERFREQAGTRGFANAARA
jgi:hypothetical protein